MTVARSTDGTLEESPGDDALRIETLQGMMEKEGAMLVRSADRTTAHLNDAVFNMAGGVELNLTAADYVFVLDPCGNPAAEAQAVGRFRWRTSSPLASRCGESARLGTAGTNRHGNLRCQPQSAAEMPRNGHCSTECEARASEVTRWPLLLYM